MQVMVEHILTFHMLSNDDVSLIFK